MINSIRGRCGLPKSKCAELIDGLFETITKTLESGEDVRISGFGKFSVRDQNKEGAESGNWRGRYLDARRVVTFKSALSSRRGLTGKTLNLLSSQEVGMRIHVGLRRQACPHDRVRGRMTILSLSSCFRTLAFLVEAVTSSLRSSVQLPAIQAHFAKSPGEGSDIPGGHNAKESLR